MVLQAFVIKIHQRFMSKCYRLLVNNLLQFYWSTTKSCTLSSTFFCFFKEVFLSLDIGIASKSTNIWIHFKILYNPKNLQIHV